MPPDRSQERRRPFLALSCIVTFALVTCYALAVGPIAKMESKGRLSPKATQVCENIYVPVAYLVGRYKPVGRFYLWYFHSVWRIPKRA